MPGVHRHLKILTLLATLMIALAACGSTTSIGDAAPTAPVVAAQPTVVPQTSAGDLEIFSWWTNGGEADGLNALFAIYKQANPGAGVFNATVTGGAGTNAKEVLQARLQRG